MTHQLGLYEDLSDLGAEYERMLTRPRTLCVDCSNYRRGRCEHYGLKLPEPHKYCRCIHFNKRIGR